MPSLQCQAIREAAANRGGRQEAAAYGDSADRPIVKGRGRHTGTRADITVPGVGGYTTSQNVLSYKVGGGLDMKLSRKIEIRLLDVDYYRTSFGTNLYQNNYWASAGIVLRLFGGSE